MIQNKKLLQASFLAVVVALFGFYVANSDVQVVEAAITETPTSPAPPPTNTPVAPTETPVPVVPTATSAPAEPTATSSGQTNNPNPTPVPPTPTPTFPQEIPELGYGPSIWVSLFTLFFLMSIIALVGYLVIQQVNSRKS